MAWYILTADQYVPLGGTQQMFFHSKGHVWRIAKRNMNLYKLHAAQCINTRSFGGFREISSVILHEVVQSALRRIGIHWYREQLGRKDREDGGVYSCISMPNSEKYVWYYLVSFVPNCYWSSKNAYYYHGLHQFILSQHLATGLVYIWQNSNFLLYYTTTTFINNICIYYDWRSQLWPVKQMLRGSCSFITL